MIKALIKPPIPLQEKKYKTVKCQNGYMMGRIMSVSII